MTPSRYPFWHMLCIVVCFLASAWMFLVIWAGLMIGAAVSLRDVLLLAYNVTLLTWSCVQFDKYTFMREHLLAERKLTREYRALQACAKLVHCRIDRGVRVYGTQLHTMVLVRKRRAMEALKAAQWFRDRRDSKA